MQLFPKQECVKEKTPNNVWINDEIYHDIYDDIYAPA